MIQLGNKVLTTSGWGTVSEWAGDGHVVITLEEGGDRIKAHPELVAPAHGAACIRTIRECARIITHCAFVLADRTEYFLEHPCPRQESRIVLLFNERRFTAMPEIDNTHGDLVAVSSWVGEYASLTPVMRVVLHQGEDARSWVHWEMARSGRYSHTMLLCAVLDLSAGTIVWSGIFAKNQWQDFPHEWPLTGSAEEVASVHAS